MPKQTTVPELTTMFGRPARQQEQRTEISGLMQKLAEARTLSFMGKLELSRSTMNLIGNLEREIRDEIGKATRKD